MTLLDETAHMFVAAAELAATDEARQQLEDVHARLSEPLRVALIGRVKAGKSTLLNALVGDLVAPTDAAECTTVPTEYHSGPTYRAWRVMGDGDIAPARFLRDDDGAHIDFGSVPVADVARLLVEFPSPLLQAMTIVDTPGLGSVNAAVSQRTIDFTSKSEAAPADAVVYLLRSWHAVDSEFLAGFHDRVGVEVPPVNAVAVLSRADEVDGGGYDALEKANVLARSLAEDATLRSLVSTVVPVAGLLAETAATLTESDFRLVVALSHHSAPEVDDALLSVDRFVAPERLVSVPAPSREHLLRRLGLFGLRYGVAAVRSGTVQSANDLCRGLTAVSGLEAVRSLIFGQLTSRAATMRAAYALDLLDAMLDDGRVRWDEGLASALERLQVNAFEIAELKTLNDVLCSPNIGLGVAARTEVARLLGADGPDVRARLQLPVAAPADEVRVRLRQELDRWRARATSDASLPHEQRLARTIARSLTNVAASAALL